MPIACAPRRTVHQSGEAAKLIGFFSEALSLHDIFFAVWQSEEFVLEIRAILGDVFLRAISLASRSESA